MRVHGRHGRFSPGKVVLAILALAAATLTLAAMAWACAPPGFGLPPTPLNVSPFHGPSGTSVAVTASRYASSSQVELYLASGPHPEDRTWLATTTTDAEGRLDATVTIPDVPAGDYAVLAGDLGIAHFEVTPARQPAPAAPVAGASAPTTPAIPAPAAASALTPLLMGAARDTTAPRVSARLRSSRRASRLTSRGLVLSMWCSEACRIAARAHVRGAVVGRGAASLAGTNRGPLAITLSPLVPARLKRVRTVSLRITLTVTDLADNATVVRRTVTLRP